MGTYEPSASGWRGMVEGSTWKDTSPVRSAARLTVSPPPRTAFIALRVEADSGEGDSRGGLDDLDRRGPVERTPHGLRQPAPLAGERRLHRPGLGPVAGDPQPLEELLEDEVPRAERFLDRHGARHRRLEEHGQGDAHRSLGAEVGRRTEPAPLRGRCQALRLGRASQVRRQLPAGERSHHRACLGRGEDLEVLDGLAHRRAEATLGLLGWTGRAPRFRPPSGRAMDGTRGTGPARRRSGRPSRAALRRCRCSSRAHAADRP